VSVGTAVLALVVSLDGDGATTYMICVAAMLPLYQRIGMSPRIMVVNYIAHGISKVPGHGDHSEGEQDMQDDETATPRTFTGRYTTSVQVP
ncbi:hypothetical protein Q6304_27925, partial [Klebsiella pneumoniae]|nr:hypothetical protein [Klebsiella pneumoniae]